MNFVAVLLLAVATPAQSKGSLAWKEGEPRQAMRDAREQKRPILLYFTSDG